MNVNISLLLDRMALLLIDGDFVKFSAIYKAMEASLSFEDFCKFNILVKQLEEKYI